MRFLPSAKIAGTFVLIVFSVFIGFVSSFYFINSRERIDEIEKVYAEVPANSDLSGALALQNTYRKVASHVLPVVVEIDAVEFQEAGNQTFTNPFNFFFGPQNQEDEDSQGEEDDNESRQFRSEGLGSGILVKRDGDIYYVLTNNHVAGNADEITIKLYDEREYDALVVGTDERKDLALLSFETSEDLEIGILGDSDDLYVGDFVLAVGNPFGFKSTVTSGIISALGRQQGPDENISDFIQTDASINQGNSGGALVNLKGEIIGVNTWITTPTGGSIGLGFSIPINNAKKAISDIIDKGSPEYGWLGVSINNVSEQVAESLGLDKRNGAFISQVFKNSPADKGGIQPGDVIRSIDGETVKTSDELLYLIGDLTPGTRVEFELIRNGVAETVRVRIEKRESEDEVLKLSSSNLAWPGAVIIPLSEEVRNGLSIDDNQNGVVIYQVYPKTPLQIAGLKSGDLIQEINGTAVESLKDFYNLLNSSDKINFTYIREGVTMETSSIVNR
jgi:Do/DeqQ family serine protease